MFQWLKYWEGPAVVIGVVVIPGFVAAAFFVLPFLDRRLERKIWRRPIPALAVAIVVAGMISLGIKSQIDDQLPTVAQQLARQHEDEKVYSAAPFEPYTASTGVAPTKTTAVSVIDPLVHKGKDVFTERGCGACHGDDGTGSALAPSLVGIADKFPQERLAALLHNPNSRMKAGGMPTVDASPDEMDALIAYLASLGKPVAGSRTASNADPFQIRHDTQSGESAVAKVSAIR
jgi:mono/diheme cytochrome c family protein